MNKHKDIEFYLRKVGDIYLVDYVKKDGTVKVWLDSRNESKVIARKNFIYLIDSGAIS